MSSRHAVTALLIALTAGHVASAPAASPWEKSCLVRLEHKARAGDGETAKLLAIYYGDERSAHGDPARALRYLKIAIARGVDVAEVARRSSRGLMLPCPVEQPPSRAVVSPVQDLAAGPEMVPGAPEQLAMAPPAAADGARPKKTGRTAHKRKASHHGAPARTAVKREESARAATVVVIRATALEYERLAAEAEWRGDMHSAVKLWERARGEGSRVAARRLYQIYSFGSGDVEPDYLKAIEASKIAQNLGLAVPDLPRK
jgi:hypothetical protein